MWSLSTLITIAAQASVYLLFSLGLSMVWGSVGLLNFAHGSVFLFCAYVPCWLDKHYALPIIVLILIGVSVGAAVTVCLHVLVYLPLLNRQPIDGEFRTLMAGIGAAAILLAVVDHGTGGAPFGLTKTGFSNHAYHLGNAQLHVSQILILACAVVVAVGGGLWMRYSKHGLALRALGVDPSTTSLMGVRSNRLSTGAMALAGALAGLAGVLLTLDIGAMDLSTGNSYIVKGFAIVILGGIGSMAGVVLGSILLATAETVILLNSSGTWVDAASFGLILVVLLLRPQGLLGKVEVRRT